MCAGRYSSHLGSKIVPLSTRIWGIGEDGAIQVARHQLTNESCS